MFHLDYRPVILESGQWIQVLVFLAFIISRYRRWTQLREISSGFFLIGLAVLFALTVALVLMMFGPQRITAVRVIVYSSLFIFEEYSYWYFERLDVPMHDLQNVRKVPLPGRRVFLPVRKFLRYLLTEPEPHPFWEMERFRDIALVIIGLLVCAFGFSRAINMYTDGVNYGIQYAKLEQKKTEAKSVEQVNKAVNTAVNTAVSSATVAIQKVADTLKQGQQELKREVKTSKQEAKETADGVRRDLRKTNAQLSRPPRMNFNTPASPQIPQTNYNLPSTLPRAKKVSGDVRTDSSTYAQIF